MTSLATGITERLRAHAGEVAAVLGVVVAVRVTGVAGAGHAWLLAALLAFAVVVSATAYSTWGRATTGYGLHLRSSLQVAALVALVAASGAGPALIGPVLLLGVADNVRYSGARAGRAAVGWALAGIAGHQAAVTVLELPSVVGDNVGHGLAVLGGVVVVLVGQRITRLAGDGEAARDDIADAQARIQSVLAGASDMIMIIADGQVTYQSPSTSRLLGYRPDQLVGRRYLDLVHPDDRGPAVEFVVDLLDAPGASGLLQCRLLAADGSYLPVESNCRNLLDDPSIRGFVVTARDISERERLERQLQHKAFHDDLTGLANRALLLDRLEHAGARAERGGRRYAVLYVDLDGFKPVNDTFGHVAGDVVLVAVAERLRGATRLADTVARLGGDEFAVLLEEHHEPVDAARVADRILEALRDPIVTASGELQVTASIGIAYDADGSAPEDVLRNADIAMYLAKRDGNDRFEVFEPQMHVAVVERLHLESDLQRAIDGGELRVHYQPIVTLADRRVVGVEALVRWEHPQRGTISPAQFIPLAEETGLIVRLGQHVLRAACTQVATWRRELPGASSLNVSVNVSMRQFSLGDLLTDVRSALAGSGLPPEALTLELTESALAHDTEHTLEILQQLKSLGVRLAVDDFGTGYSSLAYLHRFPVDVLKIDRSFVTSVVNGQQSPALARAIVELGRSLDLLTVAEGIEHDAELTQFRELECTLGQGYLFARPADATTTAAGLVASFRASDRSGELTDVAERAAAAAGRN